MKKILSLLLCFTVLTCNVIKANPFNMFKCCNIGEENQINYLTVQDFKATFENRNPICSSEFLDLGKKNSCKCIILLNGGDGKYFKEEDIVSAVKHVTGETTIQKAFNAIKEILLEGTIPLTRFLNTKNAILFTAVVCIGASAFSLLTFILNDSFDICEHNEDGLSTSCDFYTDKSFFVNNSLAFAITFFVFFTVLTPAYVILTCRDKKEQKLIDFIKNEVNNLSKYKGKMIVFNSSNLKEKETVPICYCVKCEKWIFGDSNNFKLSRTHNYNCYCCEWHREHNCEHCNKCFFVEQNREMYCSDQCEDLANSKNNNMSKYLLDDKENEPRKKLCVIA